VNNAHIHNNLIQNNHHGILLAYHAGSNTIENNQIVNNLKHGVYSGGYSGNTGNEIHYNLFENNGDHGVYSKAGSAGVLDATLNWWNSQSGPSGIFSGVGDKVSSNVNFVEYLCDPEEFNWISVDGECKSPVTPIQTGYNFNDGSGPELPRDPNMIACTDGATNVNAVSVHWQDVSTGNTTFDQYLRYKRQYRTNSGAWSGNEVYTNPYTNYRSFGGGSGSENTYGSRVQSFFDFNLNNQLDLNEPVSDWSNECSITYDKTAPTTPGTPVPSPASPTNETTQSWTWTDATDNFSDILNYFYRYTQIGGAGAVLGWTDNGTNNSVSTFLTEGIWKLFVKAVDNAGNESAEVSSQEYTVDTTPPTKPVMNTIYKGHNSNTWTNIGCAGFTNDTKITIEWTPNPESDIDFYWFGTKTNPYHKKVDGSKNIYKANMTPGNNPYRYTVIAVDEAGNESPISEACGDLSLDQSAPITTIEAPTDSQVLSGTVDLIGTIIDENLQDYVFSIEEVGGSVITTQTITASSLNNEIFYSWDTEGVGDGNYLITLMATDKAGNSNAGSEDSITVSIDNTPPETEITAPGEAQPDNPQLLVTNDWDGSILGIATDAGSGVKEVLLSIERTIGLDVTYWDGSDWVTGSETTTRVKADGTTSWEYEINGEIEQATYVIKSHGVDELGNTEETTTLTIVFDQTIPQVDLTVDPTNPDGQNGWYKTRPTVTLQANDDYEVDFIQYSWNSSTGPWSTYSGPIQIAGQGSYVLYYQAIDLAGNESNPIGIKNLRWDEEELKDGPFNVSANPGRTSGTKSTISWDAADDAVGIDRYEVIWKLKGGSIEYSKSVSGGVTETEIDKMTEEGEWEVIVRAYDGVGNSKDGSVNVIIDRTAPSAPTLTLAGTGTGTATLSWNTVEDASRYIIYYGTTAGEYLYAASVGNVTSYTVQGLAAGDYYFVVRAVDSTDNQSANSNEVSTGTIAGAAGIGGNTPAQGFGPAGDVLGVTDETPSTSGETADTPSKIDGQVAGLLDVQCDSFGNNFPWIVLTVLILATLVAEFALRQRTGLFKLAVLGGIFLITMIAYYFLRNTDCFSTGSFTALANNGFWLITIILMGLIRLAGYAFIEEIEV